MEAEVTLTRSYTSKPPSGGYYAELNDLDASVTTPPGLVNEYYAMENEVDEANCTHILN
tara:strand:- start:749 stop:925 length:177 start_codon:yes stop_codon:yes gene_type:complete